MEKWENLKGEGEDRLKFSACYKSIDYINQNCMKDSSLESTKQSDHLQSTFAVKGTVNLLFHFAEVFGVENNVTFFISHQPGPRKW